MNAAMQPPPRRLLHVGCGPRNAARLPAGLQAPHWQEIRFDIDAAVQPDIVGSITDLGALADASVEAIYSSHNLEHLHGYEVPQALREFRRVLNPQGFVLLTLPDLGAIARQIAHGQLEQPLYHSAAGPISALDMLFGHQASLRNGNHYMAHRTGFTAETLARHLLDAGFGEVRVHQGRHWDLWALATPGAADPQVLEQLAGVLS